MYLIKLYIILVRKILPLFEPLHKIAQGENQAGVSEGDDHGAPHVVRCPVHQKQPITVETSGVVFGSKQLTTE